MQIEYNKAAMAAINTIMASCDPDNPPSRNDIYEAVAVAIDPLGQRLVVIRQHNNGIAKLQTVDGNGAICMEWHDVLTTTCDTCGEPMDKYSPSGRVYQICNTCASQLPDPYADPLGRLAA